jgi:hypothetical protein
MHNPKNLKDEAGGGGRHKAHKQEKVEKKSGVKIKIKRKRNHSRIGERILINYSIRVESDYHASHEGHCK